MNLRTFFRICFFVAFSAGLAAESRAGMLTGTFAQVATGSNVDLTAVGKLDWMHWGLYTVNSLNRKASVTPQIGNFALVGDNSTSTLAAYQYADNYNGYTWYDGMPVAAVTNTTTGVWAYDYIPIGSGFQLTAPAGTNVQTLLVYVGAFDAAGQFTASLSDNSATAFTNSPVSTVNNIGNGPGGVFGITYAANSSNQMLTVRWTVATARGTDANVTLQAAALTATNANNPPYIIVTNPVSNAAFLAPTNVAFQAVAQDFDGTVTNVAFYAGTNKLGQVPNSSSNSYNFTWTNAPRGHYFVTAYATDDTGTTGRSQPVEIFVYGTGGGQTNAITSPSPATVDLTSEGTADWTHWGTISGASFDSKYLVARQISNFTEIGSNPIQQYSDNYTSFSWSDGTPTASTNGTTTGVFVYGETNGFWLTAPADGYPRQLRLYVGGYGVQGQFQAWLSDFSAAPFIDTASVSNVYGNSYVAYTIAYTAATTNQQLCVVWRPLQLFDEVYGNVTLQAATLQSTAPPQAVIANPQMVGTNLTFMILAQTNHTYSVQAKPSLNSGSWQTLTNFPGNGTVVTVTNQSVPGSTGFYRVMTQ